MTVAYTGNSSASTLTVTDVQSHTANISFAGNYKAANFLFASDEDGGMIVIDPPAKQGVDGLTQSPIIPPPELSTSGSR